jgi:glyoxylase-like metal-dependent hydrolase (beta-lactamase superfamily II)
MRFSILLALCLPALTLAQAAQPITVTDLGGGLAMLRGAGGNLLLSTGEDGSFLVDDQYAYQAEGILEEIGKRTEKPLRFVVNTHWHGDHSGGNQAMAEHGAVVVAHENVRRRMATEQFIAAFQRKVPASPEEALPVVTFTDRVTFHWNGHTVRVQHLGPAHTDGDSLVHFEEADVIHTGDTFFHGFYPFMDASSGGRLDGMIAAAEQVLTRTDEDTRIVPGHGPLATPSDLRAYRDMLAGVRDALAPMIEAGRTDDEIVAAKPTAPWDARWGGGFLKPDAWVRIVLAAMR